MTIFFWIDPEMQLYGWSDKIKGNKRKYKVGASGDHSSFGSSEDSFSEVSDKGKEDADN